MPERPEDILPRLTLDDLTPDDLMLAGFDTEAFSGAPRPETVMAASGTVWSWWGAVVAFAQIWTAFEPGRFEPWQVIAAQAGLGVAGSLPLLYRMALHGVFRQWHSQILPVMWLTATCGAAILILAGSAPGLCILLAVVFAVMAMVGRTRWLLIVTGGWLLAALLTCFAHAPLYHHLCLGGAAVLFLLLPGIKLWRLALRQSAVRQFGLL